MIIKELVEAGEKAGVALDSAQYERSEPYLKANIKGVIGMDLFEDASFIRPVNDLLPEYRTAVGIINDDKRYRDILAGRVEKQTYNNIESSSAAPAATAE